MKLFLDTEFNGFQSNCLISMALVAEDGRQFYEVLEWPLYPHPWVAANVLPMIEDDKEPLGFEKFRLKLWEFLLGFDSIHVIADWPEDLMYFFQSLTLHDYCRRLPPVTSEWYSGPKTVKSRKEHNALADAQALKDSYQKET